MAEGFSRTQAILDARRHTDAEVLVVTDADVFTSPEALRIGVEKALAVGWAVPNLLLHRLSEVSSQRVMHGAAWHGQSLSQDNPQDSRPYKVHECGTLFVIATPAFDMAPPDPRFVGWGSEDTALAFALRTLVGPPWRGAEDLVHLYHPPEPRQSRIVGNDANRALLARYRKASRNPIRMSELIEEARGDHDHRSHPAPAH